MRALWLVSFRPHGTPPVRERQNSISAEEPAAAPGPVAADSAAPPSPDKSAVAGAPRPSATLAVPGAPAVASAAAVLLPSLIDPSKFAPAVSVRAQGALSVVCEHRRLTNFFFVLVRVVCRCRLTC